jgi:alkylated DNA repair dioxygenase AlkB
MQPADYSSPMTQAELYLIRWSVELTHARPSRGEENSPSESSECVCVCGRMGVRGRMTPEEIVFLLSPVRTIPARSTIASEMAAPASTGPLAPIFRAKEKKQQGGVGPGKTPDHALWTLHSGVMTPAECATAFRALKALVDPEPNRVFVWGAWHTEDRLTGSWTRDVPDEFEYSGSSRKTTGEWPPILQQLSTLAATRAPLDTVRKQAVVPADFDLAHVNLYRNGADKLGAHRDRDGVQHAIASFTFYDPDPPAAAHATAIPKRVLKANPQQLRDFVFKSDDGTINETLKLENGSLLLMHPPMQVRGKHAVPERAGIQRARINVTLRQYGLKSKGQKRSSSEHADSATAAATAAAAAAAAPAAARKKSKN